MASKREKELETILKELTPAVRDVLWCALVWNDHNFSHDDLREKAARAAKSLGYTGVGKLGEDIPKVNAWMERVDKALHGSAGERQ